MTLAIISKDAILSDTTEGLAPERIFVHDVSAANKHEAGCCRPFLEMFRVQGTVHKRMSDDNAA